MFHPGLWLGHSRIVRGSSWSHSSIILTVCFRSLSCSEVNHQPFLRLHWLYSFLLSVFGYIHPFLNSDQYSCSCCWETITMPYHEVGIWWTLSSAQRIQFFPLQTCNSNLNKTTSGLSYAFYSFVSLHSKVLPFHKYRGLCAPGNTQLF